MEHDFVSDFFLDHAIVFEFQEMCHIPYNKFPYTKSSLDKLTSSFPTNNDCRCRGISTSLMLKQMFHFAKKPIWAIFCFL